MTPKTLSYLYSTINFIACMSIIIGSFTQTILLNIGTIVLILSILFLRKKGDKDFISNLLNNMICCIIILIGIIGFVLIVTSTQGLAYVSIQYDDYINSPDYLELEESCQLEKDNNMSKSVDCLDKSIESLSYTTIVMGFGVLWTIGGLVCLLALILFMS